MGGGREGGEGMQSAGVQMLGNYFSYRIHSGIFISGISLPLRLFFPFLSCTGLCRLDPPPPPFFFCAWEADFYRLSVRSRGGCIYLPAVVSCGSVFHSVTYSSGADKQGRRC